MFSMIESWRRGGQGQQDFCKTQRLTYRVFRYWHKKYREAQAAIQTPLPFVPVHIQRALSNTPVAELIFPDGRRVNFYQAVDASFMRTLLAWRCCPYLHPAVTFCTAIKAICAKALTGWAALSGMRYWKTRWAVMCLYSLTKDGARWSCCFGKVMVFRFIISDWKAVPMSCLHYRTRPHRLNCAAMSWCWSCKVYRWAVYTDGNDSIRKKIFSIRPQYMHD